MGDGPHDRADAWYFAYASNMHPDKRRQRAGLRALEEAPAIVEGFALVFDMPGVPPAEPAMANIRESPGACVHGLLVRLTADDFDALLISEGGSHFYRVISLPARTYDGRSVQAQTLVGRPGRTRARLGAPSRRYMSLVREGARLCGLDPVYRAALDAAPESDASPAARWCSALVLELFTRASRSPLHELAHRCMLALQATEALPRAPRAAAQALMLAPTITLGLALRAADRLRGRPPAGSRG